MAERTLPAFDLFGKVSSSKPWRRADGLWTMNQYGYDMADIICQKCILGDHLGCTVEPHVHMGYSTCDCNVGLQELQREGRVRVVRTGAIS